MSPAAPRFRTFGEFYPFYLSEHENRTCKVLHFTGTLLVILLVVLLSWTEQWASLGFLLPVAGYGLAWIGHFFFERNRPAAFRYPLYSLTADFLMFFHLLTGKLSFATGASLRGWDEQENDAVHEGSA